MGTVLLAEVAHDWRALPAWRVFLSTGLREATPNRSSVDVPGVRLETSCMLRANSRVTYQEITAQTFGLDARARISESEHALPT